MAIVCNGKMDYRVRHLLVRGISAYQDKLPPGSLRQRMELKDCMPRFWCRPSLLHSSPACWDVLGSVT